MAPPYKPTGKGPPLAPVMSPATAKAVAAKAAKARADAATQAYLASHQARDIPAALAATQPQPQVAPPVQNPWAAAAPVASLTKGVTKTVTPAHPLAHPPPAKPKPVVTHPHTIQVTPGAGTAAPTYSTAPPPAAASTVPPAATTAASPAPKVDLGKNGFFTTKAAAQKALPPDVPGSVVKFTKGKGYYIATGGKGAAAKGKGRAGSSAAAGLTIDDQVNAALKAELDPQTAAINSGYQQILTELKAQQDKATADAAAQAQTVQGYYGALTPLLQGIGPAVQGGYQDAAAGIAGAAKGFSGELGAQATADAAKTAALLGQNAAPQAQVDAAAQAAGAGGGAANALYGLGGFIPSAELSAQGAAVGAAARQLPATYSGIGAQNAAQALGIGSANVRDIGTTIGQQAQKHAADLATLAAGVPKLRNDLTAAYGTAQRQQAQLDFEERLRASQYGEKVANDQFNQKATTARIGLETVRAQTSRESAAARAASTSFGQRLSFAKTYGYDPVTGAVVPGFAKNAQGQVVKTGKAGAKKGGLSDSQAAKLVAQWHDGAPKSVTTIARDAKGNPIPNAAGAPETTTQTVVTGQMQYGQAYKMLRTFGKGDLQARQLLNTVYKRGDSGRAWVTNEEQAALGRAGLPTRARMVQGHAVLTPVQYAALVKAGHAPPGTNTTGGFVIDQVF